MKISKRAILILGITLALGTMVLFIYILPIATKVNASLKVYETQSAIKKDYKLHTTALPKSVVEDLCLKLDIKESSEQCQADAVVYAPDLFDEIKAYFKNLPKEDKTYDVIQDKLGAYLDYCAEPDPDGVYRCRYDLRGDDVYPFYIYYDKNGRYYDIIASAGGS